METIAPVDLNFYAIAPLLTLALATVLILIIDVALPKGQSRRWWYVASFGGVLVSLWYVISLWSYLPGGGSATSVGPGQLGRLTDGIDAFGGALIVDRFSLIFTAIILLAAAGSILMSVVRQEEEMSGYLSLIVGSTLGMAVLVGAGNLITLFLGLEILSLNLYVAVAFKPNDKASKEAALKYLILGSVASAIMLYGFAFLYGQTGTLALAGLAAGWSAESTVFMKVGLGLSMVALIFKMALAPFHIWAPDVYQGSTSQITAFMSVATKAAAFAALVRVLIALLPEGGSALMIPLWFVAVLSMLIGSFGAAVQNNLKRLLAYSGVTHAGYLMMALLGFSNQGIQAGVFYLGAYLFMNVGAFAVIVWLSGKEREAEEINDFTGLFYKRPVLALSMTLFLLSLAGFPPAGGFPGKLFLILSSLNSGAGPAAGWLVGTLVFTSAVSAYAYLRVVTTMFRRDETQGAKVYDDSPNPQIDAVAVAGESSITTSDAVNTGQSSGFSWALAAVVGVAALGTLYLGLMPKSVLSLADRLLPLL